MPDKDFLVPRSLQGRRTAVIYARVNTPYQVRGGGLQRQIENCAAFAERAGLEVIAVHQETAPSGSGYETRAALQASLEDLEAKRAEVFLVESLDRLSCAGDSGAGILARIEQAGAVLVPSEAQVVGGATQEFHAQISQAITDYREALIDQVLERSVLLSEATRVRLVARALREGLDFNALADTLLADALGGEE